MMFKIVFHYRGQEADEVYGGGRYVVNGETYAVLNNVVPKLYKFEKVAANSAEKLLHSCVNTATAESYSIEKANEEEICNFLARKNNTGEVQSKAPISQNNTVTDKLEELKQYQASGLTPEQVLDMAENAETRLLTWFEARYGFPVGVLMDICEEKQKQLEQTQKLPSLLEERRKTCPMRHENGNCTVAGGFCTAVIDPICEALHNAYECGFRAGILRAKKSQEEHI